MKNDVATMAVNSAGKQSNHFVSTINEAIELTEQTESIATSPEKWMSAAAVKEFLYPTLEFSTYGTLGKRLYAGHIRARCDSFFISENQRRDFVIPRGFWWAQGEAALKSNWVTGDFETWLDNTVHLRAFGVMFYRTDIEKILPAKALPPLVALNYEAPPSVSSRNKGGRPKNDFWEELWVEIARQREWGKPQARKNNHYGAPAPQITGAMMHVLRESSHKHDALPLPWGEGWGEGVHPLIYSNPLTRRYAPTSPHRGEV